LRIEASERGGGNAYLLDYGRKKSYVILSGREQYVEMPALAEPAKSTTKMAEVNIEKTDRTETIVGYECDEFTVTAGDVSVDLWATKEFGTAGTFLVPQVFEMQWKFIEMGYFPMKYVLRDSTGEETYRFEVVSVQEKSLSSSLFRIPSGYEKVGPEALERSKPVTKKKRTR
jgi:hypothetical protein